MTVITPTQPPDHKHLLLCAIMLHNRSRKNLHDNLVHGGSWFRISGNLL